jgi:hypothetical protein
MKHRDCFVFLLPLAKKTRKDGTVLHYRHCEKWECNGHFEAILRLITETC